MNKAILATKVGMTQIFNGRRHAGSGYRSSGRSPCVVTQIKTVENDGYSAVQVGFVTRRKELSTETRAERKRSFTDMA